MKYQTIISIGETDIKEYIEKNVLADITEIRLDLFSKDFTGQSLQIELRKIKTPLLFTYRMPEDKGGTQEFFHEAGDFESILNTFNSEKNFIDIELDKKNDTLEYNNTLMYRTINSIHNFQRILSLEEMEVYIKNENTILKFAVMPNSLEESFQFLQSIQTLSTRIPVIGVCMGEFGKLSRVFGDSFGSLATYLCFKTPKAPGQIQLEKFLSLRNKYSLKEINWTEFQKLDLKLKTDK